MDVPNFDGSDDGTDWLTVQNYSRSAVAALTLLAWDTLITLDDEVHYIWAKKCSAVGLAYFFTRYATLIAEIVLLILSPDARNLDERFVREIDDCRMWQIYRATVTVSILISLDIIFIARVIALYHDRPKIRCFIIVLFGLEVICMVTGQVLGNKEYIFDSSCKVYNLPIILRTYSSAAIGFQSVLFILTMYKFLQGVKSGWDRMPLAVLLVRDGSWAFLLFLAVQTTIYYVLDNSYKRLLYPWMWTICSFCGCRMLLNVRKFAGSENRMTNIESIFLASIEINPRVPNP